MRKGPSFLSYTIYLRSIPVQRDTLLLQKVWRRFLQNVARDLWTSVHSIFVLYLSFYFQQYLILCIFAYNQVSNWFINARVRLWKPMIEEMYLEMNRRKNRRNDEEKDRANLRNHISIDYQRFKMIWSQWR